MTVGEPIVEVGCDSLPEDLERRLEVESSLGSSQRQEVTRILTAILYCEKLVEDEVI